MEANLLKDIDRIVTPPKVHGVFYSAYPSRSSRVLSVLALLIFLGSSRMTCLRRPRLRPHPPPRRRR